MLLKRLVQPCARPGPIRRALHASPLRLAVLGLRAEDPLRRWERRTALDPRAVGELIKEGHEVLIEHCTKRAIPQSDYAEVRFAISILIEISTDKRHRLTQRWAPQSSLDWILQHAM